LRWRCRCGAARTPSLWRCSAADSCQRTGRYCRRSCHRRPRSPALRARCPTASLSASRRRATRWASTRAILRVAQWTQHHPPRPLRRRLRHAPPSRMPSPLLPAPTCSRARRHHSASARVPLRPRWRRSARSSTLHAGPRRRRTRMHVRGEPGRVRLDAAGRACCTRRRPCSICAAADRCAWRNAAADTCAWRGAAGPPGEECPEATQRQARPPQAAARAHARCQRT
jgi:hypothetical protein